MPLPVPSPDAQQHSARLSNVLRDAIAAGGGWIPFARFMELSLYAPGLGYYSAGANKLGAAGDFTTAPEISPLFGRTLARQAAEIMAQSSPHILELGAGSGTLAADILGELERMDALPERYDILEVSADFKDRQQALLQARLPHLMDRLHWLDALPNKISGAAIANEVLDALPVHLVRWNGNEIFERGVALSDSAFAWQDRPVQNPALESLARNVRVPSNYLSEISIAGRNLVATLCERLQNGALLFIDYGFGQDEYYHPQRNAGTLMCHYRHHSHDDPFYLPGLQDITSHVDFTAVAETAIDAGAELLGYTTQAHFLINCGITDFLSERDPKNLLDYLPLSTQLQKLTSPAEMGELFKVIALGKNLTSPLLGFRSGDKSHRLNPAQ